jgi:hypothetical protein
MVSAEGSWIGPRVPAEQEPLSADGGRALASFLFGPKASGGRALTDSVFARQRLLFAIYKGGIRSTSRSAVNSTIRQSRSRTTRSLTAPDRSAASDPSGS